MADFESMCCVCCLSYAFFFSRECAWSEWSPKRSEAHTYTTVWCMSAECYVLCVGMCVECVVFGCVLSKCCSCHSVWVSSSKRTIVCDYTFMKDQRKVVSNHMKTKNMSTALAIAEYIVYREIFFGCLVPLRIEWLTVKKRRIMLKRILTVVLSVITHSSFSLPDVFCSFLYPFIDGTVSLRNIIIFTNFKAIYNMCHTGNTKLLYECLWLIVMFSVFFILSFQIFFSGWFGWGCVWVYECFF